MNLNILKTKTMIGRTFEFGGIPIQQANRQTNVSGYFYKNYVEMCIGLQTQLAWLFELGISHKSSVMTIQIVIMETKTSVT